MIFRTLRRKKKKWALALMGGGARGLAHIGVLDVLQKNRLIPDIVVGTSMGGIIGGLFCSGFSPGKLKEMTKDLSLSRFIDRPNLFFLSRKPHSIVDILMMMETYKNRILRKMGLAREDKLEDYFKSLVGELSIEELPIKFACNAVDLVSGREVVFKNGKLHVALRATMSLPIMFEPVKLDEMLLVDGGVLNNVPVDVAKQLGADKAILVDIHRALKEVTSDDIKNAFQLVQRMVETMMASNTREKIGKADYVIRVDVDVDIFDFSAPLEIVETGERAMSENLETVKKLL